jgi:hypothetical protein
MRPSRGIDVITARPAKTRQESKNQFGSGGYFRLESSLDPERNRLMRSLSKIASAIGVIAAVALTASAADARSFHGAYDYVGGNAPSASIPFDANGPAYTRGQRGLDSSSDFQLQGR